VDIVFEHPGRETFGASVYVTRKGGTIVTCASTSNRYLWMMRTYAAHSPTTARPASNELYRRSNLAKGQTGLSVAFDLPTQTGYDPDHGVLARGEVGKVGVPIAHKRRHAHALFDGIPLEPRQMNTSMTINATAAMWLLALYMRRGHPPGRGAGRLRRSRRSSRGAASPSSRHDPERHRQGVPVARHATCSRRPVAAADDRHDRATRSTTCRSGTRSTSAATTCRRPGRRRCRRSRTRCPPRSPCSTRCATPARSPRTAGGDVVARISFFVNAGVRFVEEMCKMRAFGRSGTRSPASATASRPEAAPLPLRRAGQLARPDRGAAGEQRPADRAGDAGVTLSKDARARAVQLPAWNEALGLPRPWDQQWSLRMQQVLAYETDLLEYETSSRARTSSRPRSPPGRGVARRDRPVQEMGGAMAAVESGYLKSQLVSSHAERRARIESGRGEDRRRQHLRTRPSRTRSPPTSTRRSRRSTRPSRPGSSSRQRWRDTRYQPPFNHPRPCKALERLKEAAKGTGNLMEATLECARAGVTTGEWAGALREVFGEFRAPTGVSSAPVAVPAEEGSAMAAGAPQGGVTGERDGRPASCASWSASRAWTGTPTAPSRSPYGPVTPASRWSTRASG
jgi:(2R)-ethylmalonyl-CoA mutase